MRSSSASSTNFSANFASSVEAQSQQGLGAVIRINPIVVEAATTMETITFSSNLSNRETKMGQVVACRRKESGLRTWTVSSMQSFRETIPVVRGLRHRQTEARKGEDWGHSTIQTRDKKGSSTTKAGGHLAIKTAYKTITTNTMMAITSHLIEEISKESTLSTTMGKYSCIPMSFF